MYSFAKKLKKPLLSVLGLTLVAVLTVAGTLAYLQDESEEVVNTFKANGVTVTLTETTGETYDIIPGTTVPKDPTVTVDNTLDAFVFVEITDATNGLVGYEIADGWEVLKREETPKQVVLYREVAADATAENKTFQVLKNDQVTYAADLTNEDMLKNDGKTLKDGITLTFKASAIQKEPFNTAENAWKQVPAEVATRNDFVHALKDGKTEIVLNDDIKLSMRAETVTNDTVIDLKGHTLTGASYKSALNIENANVTIKGGTIEGKPSNAGSVLYAYGTSNLTVEDCTIKTNRGYTYAVCTNGSESLDTTIYIKNSTISAPTKNGSRTWAAYIPAGNVTFENCNVTGHVYISGGNVTLDGGVYTATGFNNQTYVYNNEQTAEYVMKSASGTAISMGDSILITDRRDKDAYQITSLTIKNITFNTGITFKDGSPAVAYAIKYVDMGKNPNADRVPYVIENNTYNNKIDGADPVMFIDSTGVDITAP